MNRYTTTCLPGKNFSVIIKQKWFNGPETKNPTTPILNTLWISLNNFIDKQPYIFLYSMYWQAISPTTIEAHDTTALAKYWWTFGCIQLHTSENSMNLKNSSISNSNQISFIKR